MQSLCKMSLLAISSGILFYSCTQTPESKISNDSIPVAVVAPPSNEIMTARLRLQLQGKYDNVWDYSDGLIAVLKNEKYGFCDSTGKEVIPFLYDRPSNFREGVADVKKDGKIGFIDKTGKEIFPFKDYDYVGGFENGLSAFRIIKAGKELYGFLDKAGNQVVPPVYDDLNISWFGMGNAAIVKKGGKWGTITKQNAVVVPFEYDAINDFSNGIATAKKAGKWGVIDSANKVLVPFTMVYETVYEFNSGFAFVEKDIEHNGYIDLNGKEAFGGLIFREAFPFSNNGFAIVSDATGGRYLIDTKGTPFLKGVGNIDVSGLDENDNKFIVTRDNKQGITDINNKILLPIEYTSIMPMGKNFLLVSKDSVLYYTDYKGNKVADYIPN